MAATLPLAGPAAPRRLLSPAAWHDLLGLLFVALTLLVAGKLAVPRPAVPVAALPPAACDLQREVCRLSLPDGGSVELAVAGPAIRPSQPFVLIGHSDRRDVRLLELAIRGIEQDVSGAPRPFQRSGNGFFRTDASLPLCTLSRMTWQLSVLIEADGRRLRWPLRVHTDSGG